MISETGLRQLVQLVHSEPELAGCIVVFYGNNECRVIGHPFCANPNSENVAVVIEELNLPDRRDGEAMLRASRVLSGTPKGAATNPIIKNRSKIAPELIGAGASCGLAFVATLGVFAGVATEIPTGGASTFLTVASWAGFGTASIQCANGLVRVGAMFSDLDGDTLDSWDNGDGMGNVIYKYGILVVDAIGIASAVGSLPFAYKNLWAVIERQRAFVARGLSFEALKRMSRAERLKAIAQCLKDAGRSPEGAAALRKAASDAKIAAKTLEGARGGLSVNHADTLRRIISDATAKRLSAGARDVIANVLGIGVSASPSDWTGSGSGSLNWVVHLLDAGAPKLN